MKDFYIIKINFENKNDQELLAGYCDSGISTSNANELINSLKFDTLDEAKVAKENVDKLNDSWETLKFTTEIIGKEWKDLMTYGK